MCLLFLISAAADRRLTVYVWSSSHILLTLMALLLQVTSISYVTAGLQVD